MTREEARKAAEVMLAYADGAEIERLSPYFTEWETNASPLFNWSHVQYRVKQTPDYINWDHVAPEYKWMARNGWGSAKLYISRPQILQQGDWHGWPDGDSITAGTHASYKRGTVDWKDSLVSREEWEADQ